MRISIQESPIFARVKKSGKYHYLQEEPKPLVRVKPEIVCTIPLDKRPPEGAGSAEPDLPPGDMDLIPT